MDYKDKYEQALERAKVINPGTADYEVAVKIFPELKKSEDEKIRKEIINYFKCQSIEELSRKDIHNKWIAWLEKVIIPSRNDIALSFIEDIKNVIVEAPLLMYSDKEKMIAWLEKQCTKEPKKTSIWKHWNNGIAGNGASKTIYLIKNGNDYSLSSCLGYECDYILLSDLDKLMLEENQGEQKPADNIIEEEKPLLEKFKQAVYDCAWGKVTCKVEGESKEEYANRWAEQLLTLVRDWADDYIDYREDVIRRRSFDKGKQSIQNPAWSEEDALNLNQAIYVCHQHGYFGVETWLKSLKKKNDMTNKKLIEKILKAKVKPVTVILEKEDYE